MNGYLKWFEFAPADNLYVVEYREDMTKTVSPKGIIVSTSPSSVLDRPHMGVIISRGPDAKKYDIGMTVFFNKNVTFDLGMILSENGEKYMLVPEDRIDGYRVKNIADISDDSK